MTLRDAVGCTAHPREGHALLQHGLADTLYCSYKQSLEKAFQYLSAFFPSNLYTKKSRWKPPSDNQISHISENVAPHMI